MTTMSEAQTTFLLSSVAVICYLKKDEKWQINYGSVWFHKYFSIELMLIKLFSSL